MLKIEMDDVIGVLQSCKVQIGVIVGVLALLVIALIACRKMKKSQKFLIRSQSVIAAVLAILVTANTVCFGPMSTLISLATGNGTVSEKTAEEAKEVAQQVAEEGFVLLKNDDSFLPLQNISKLNLFGWAASNPVYGGSGSGGINQLYEIVSLQKGIEDAGFEVNQELLDFYSAYTSDRPEMSIQKQSWTLPEPPVSTYSQEMIENAKNFSDTAVIVISRAAGEGHNDMPMDMSQAKYDAGPNKPTDASNPTIVKAMRRACKNIMYTVVNSWAYENGDVTVETMGWQKALMAGDAVIVIVLAAVELTYVRNGWKKRKEEENAE